MPIDKTDEQLLETIADLHGVPEGSFNIRKNGKLIARNSNTDIEIVSKKDKDGIDIIVKPGVKNKSVHIPVLLTVGDFHDTVYNDFFIGENADVTIIAGCGIHNATCADAEHDGIHTFYLKKNARVRYVERHYASGGGSGKKVFDPVTKIHLAEGAQFTLESTQLGGVTYTDRKTYATVGDPRAAHREGEDPHRRRRGRHHRLQGASHRPRQPRRHRQPQRRERKVRAEVPLRPHRQKRLLRARRVRRHPARRCAHRLYAAHRPRSTPRPASCTRLRSARSRGSS